MPGNSELVVNDISVAFADPGEKLQLPAAGCNSGQCCKPGVTHIRLVSFLIIFTCTNKFFISVILFYILIGCY